jgi:hypothetical protein
MRPYVTLSHIDNAEHQHPPTISDMYPLYRDQSQRGAVHLSQLQLLNLFLKKSITILLYFLLLTLFDRGVRVPELEGGGAGPDIIGSSQTYDAPPLQIQDDPFTPAPPPPRPHHAPDALTYSEEHMRRRPRTRGEEQESARTGTGGVHTQDLVDSVYLNYFFIILFYF